MFGGGQQRVRHARQVAIVEQRRHGVGVGHRTGVGSHDRTGRLDEAAQVLTVVVRDDVAATDELCGDRERGIDMAPRRQVDEGDTGQVMPFSVVVKRVVER